MRTLLILAALSIATPALAAPRPAAKRAKLGKPAKPVDVTAALASGAPDRLCGAAIDLAAAGDAVRAGLLIGACADLPARGVAARTARIAIDRAAARGAWSPVEIVLVGKGAATATVTIDAFAGVPLAEGSWRLPAGTYRLTATTAGGDATYDLTLAANSRALVMIEPPLPPQPPRDGVLDFGTESEPMAPPIAGPPKVKHGSLLPDRYLKGLKQCGALACRKTP